MGPGGWLKGEPLGGSCMAEGDELTWKCSEHHPQAMKHPVVAVTHLYMISESSDSIVGG
jgi:hypothetical protein